MADITLAECNGGVWLVSGEDYLHDLLGNTLPKKVSIEFVQCERPDEVRRLWIQNCGPREDGGMPWQIHPAIVTRTRRRTPDFAVYFGPWSALLDQDALIVLGAAAEQARELIETPVVVAQYLAPGGPRPMVDLAALRAHLVEEKLTELGVPRARIERVIRDVTDLPESGQESQRIDVIVRVG